MADKPAWQRLKDESAKAYAAFQCYFQMPARDRSIDAAWRADSQQTDSGKRAAPSWFRWSAEYEWIKRAAAYDEHLAEQDLLLWEERRRQLREQDWSQSDKVRSIIEDALPYARGFIHRQKHVVRRAGQTTTTIIESFDIVGLSKVLAEASKIQRLTVNEPTENINNLSGAALDALIARELQRIADGGKEADASAPANDAAGGAPTPLV